MRRIALVVLLLVPPACASADHVEIDARGAFIEPPAPPPERAEVLSLPDPESVQPLASAIAPAALDDTSPGPPPLIATSFEPASAACNDWVTGGADAIRSVPPRTGSYACRVCATGEAPELSLGRDAGAVAAGRYTLRAWVRNRPRREAPDNVSALLEAETATGVVSATSPVVVPGDAYAELLVTIDLPEGASSIRARISASATAAQCVLVDDVVLERVQ